MDLIQVKGNTWYLSDWQLIPLYMVDDRRAILLDSGLAQQRENIEQALTKAGVSLMGIICTHLHTDHAGNVFYFQNKYNIPVALPLGEAGLCVNELDLKANFYVFPLNECRQAEDVSSLKGKVNQVILPEEKMFEFCGVGFEIVHLPGHSPDHIGIRTPDNVLYVGDALLEGEDLASAKLPYHLSVEMALDSIEQLRKEKADVYLVAHCDVCTSLEFIIDENIQLLKDRCDRIEALINRPMTFSEIQNCVCQEFRMLSSKIRNAELYERSIRSYVEYLWDEGRVRVCAKDGILYYESLLI